MAAANKRGQIARSYCSVHAVPKTSSHTRQKGTAVAPCFHTVIWSPQETHLQSGATVVTPGLQGVSHVHKRPWDRAAARCGCHPHRTSERQAWAAERGAWVRSSQSAEMLVRYSPITNGREPRRRSMTRTINNRRRNQKNRHKLAALAKKAKKERNQLG